MKKYLLIIICLFLTVGCTKREEVVNDDNNEETKEEVIVVEDKYIDDNPIKLGLYINGKLINEYNTTLVDGTDIASFDVYFTNIEDVGSNNTKNNFNKYYKMYDNIDNYKIGYFVSFETTDKHYEVVVKEPNTETSLAPYIFMYLYDDIHQLDGSWYSHITMDEFNDDSILSSIKLCMVNGSHEITSPITLMVFTYDSDDDFDSEGHYRGVSSHTLIINNK